MSELALINKAIDAIEKTVFEGRKVVLPDGNVVSPAEAGWENDNFKLVAIAPFEVPADKQVVGAPTISYDKATSTASKTYTVEDIPAPPPRQIKKTTILGRLGETRVLAVMAQMNDWQKTRWYAGEMINVDDPEMGALFRQVLGMTDTEITDILTPEA